MRKENKSNNDKQCMKEKETKIREKTKVAMQVNKLMSRLYHSTSQHVKEQSPRLTRYKGCGLVEMGGGGGKTYSWYPTEPTFGNLPCWEDIFTKNGKKGKWEPSEACQKVKTKN